MASPPLAWTGDGAPAAGDCSCLHRTHTVRPVKYELDKKTGFLRVDRPTVRPLSAPTLYGFIPRTFCGKRVQALMPESDAGDGDPLDICVISERPITKQEIIVNARVVGGLPMLDNGEADDKIIAVLENDAMWSGVNDVTELPTVLVDRLRHYFSIYKALTPEEAGKVKIDAPYGRERALGVVRAAMADYDDEFGE